MIHRLFQRDDAHEFRPILAEIETRPINPIGRTFFWLLIFIFFFFGIWLYIGKIDVVVSARGKVIPDGEIKVIQSLNTGVLSQIPHRPGDYVKKGDTLVEIDPSTTEPAYASAVKNMTHFSLESERLSALLAENTFEPSEEQFSPEAVQVQKDIYLSSRMAFERLISAKKNELEKIETQMTALKDERETIQELLQVSTDRLARLEAVKDIIALETYEHETEVNLKHRQSVTNIAAKLKELKYQKHRLKDEIEFEKQKHRDTNLKEFAEKKRQIGELEEEISHTRFMNTKQRITAPVDGFVNELYVNTIGGVVTPAQKLLSLVPDETPLVIEAQVLNKDIGFVEVGMPVSIKVDAFNFQKYGMIDGQVKQISKDSILDEQLGPVYKIYVKADKLSLNVEGRQTEIKSGMTVSAEVNVGRRRIIEFFVYPLIKYLDEGMSVR